MSEAKTYGGSCHCGNVTYTVAIDLSHVMTCNCSICSRTGAVMAFVPKAAFELKSGAGAQSDYQFNTKNIHHLFCSTCGVRSFARGTDRKGREMVMINVRCLEGVDLKSLTIPEHDGRSA
jgi:hypothetical protein